MQHIDLTTAIRHDIAARTRCKERDWFGLEINTVAKRPGPARPQALRRPGKSLVPFVITGEVIGHA